MLASTVPPTWCGLEEHRLDLERRLRPRCRDDHEVDDLVQETFLRAARYRRSLSDPRKLRSWLLQIAGNVQRDQRRREGRCRASEPADELMAGLPGREEAPGAPSADPGFALGRHLVEQLSAQVHLARALRALAGPDRMLIESYYTEGGGTRLAAERAGLRPHAVKVRLFRARQRLRREEGRALEREGLERRPWQEVRA